MVSHVILLFALLVGVQVQAQCMETHRSGLGVVVTTTTTTYPSNYPMPMNIMGSFGGGGSFPGGIRGGILNVLPENQVETIQSSWNILKKRPDFPVKVMLRYLKAKPESQKLFPAFAHVPLNDLPTNKDFIHQAESCITSLNVILPHLMSMECQKCPILTQIKDRYNEVDLKKFGSIWITTMQEELGNKFTNEVHEAWKNGIAALVDYASP